LDIRNRFRIGFESPPRQCHPQAPPKASGGFFMRFALLLLWWAAGAQSPGPADRPNLPLQRIGANDLLAVSVYGAPEFSRSVRVSGAGHIRIPMLKRSIPAAGLLPEEVEQAVAEALEAEQLLVGPAVAVHVVEYQSRPISVAGAVREPVTFQASGTPTLLEALTRAGGLAPDAGPEILVSRAQPGENGQTTVLTQRIPVRGLFDEADPQLNLRLSGGEEIRVPEVGKVFVVGNVKRPGAYPVRESSETTVLRMLALAEGLAPYAAAQAFVIRTPARAGARSEIPIELKKILQRNAPDVPLLAGDILYVPDNSRRRATAAAIDRLVGFGAVTASGLLVWRR
jgi:polysaccharide export outer membrane protein